MSADRQRRELQMFDGAGLCQDLLDLIHDAVLAFDSTGTILYWNQGAERIYGWSRDQMLGQSLSLIQWDTSDTEHTVTDHSDAIWAGELHHRDRTGALLIMESRQIKRDGLGDIPDHILSINRNVTATRALQMQLKAHALELERSNAELESFARIASHDLREPLRMIGSYAKLLNRRYRDHLDEDGAEFLDYVVDGAERMSTMIRDLLHVARFGSEAIDLQPVNLNDVLAEVQSDLALMIKDEKASISVSELPTVDGDRSQLRRVFQNLIENSLKYRGTAAPTIQIDAERLLDIWKIEVRDNGPGIDGDDLNRIFVPFARGRRSEKVRGTGTGLAVARKIIHGHGGRIWAESEPGHGAVFYVTLPDRRQGDRI
ncbi:MAG: PAS domain-containing protein [Sphaerobacteraceae bacterium]|nr:MAG: PAS domain-containing protein [Sphaerobacteraceae bacterium]